MQDAVICRTNAELRCFCLGADHLTLEGWGGWFLVIKNFFLAIWWAGYFFPFFPISFLLHLCCMQFFSSDKRLQEIFFQNPPPPPPRQELNGRLLRFEDENAYEYEIWFEVFFSSIVEKNRHPEVFHSTFFSPEKLALLSLLEEVNPLIPKSDQHQISLCNINAL